MRFLRCYNMSKGGRIMESVIEFIFAGLKKFAAEIITPER